VSVTVFVVELGVGVVSVGVVAVGGATVGSVVMGGMIGVGFVVSVEGSVSVAETGG
jgi:hypothetical protein